MITSKNGKKEGQLSPSFYFGSLGSGLGKNLGIAYIIKLNDI